MIARQLAAFAFVAAGALTGCASFPRPTVEATTPDARALLDASARAHGLEAYRKLRDINVAYDGKWFDFVTRVQPVLTDPQFRGSSEERLLPREDRIAQAHRGPRGTKQVLRAGRAASVWYNGTPDTNAEQRDASAIVADAYRFFLLGPLYLIDRTTVLEVVGRGTVEGRECDILSGRMRPGFGRASEDRIQLWIDREDKLTRRMWISIDGLASTQNVVAEFDLFDYVEHAGVRWPTRYFERLLRPLPIDVHQWRLTGLDVDRGYDAQAIAGPSFTGAASAPARPLAR
jgi:hypothetical protein